MEKTNVNIQEELMKVGFTGELLGDLLKVIVNADTLQDFYNHVLTEGEGMTRLLLVHSYLERISNKGAYDDYNEFVSDYDNAATEEDKLLIIAKLFAEKVAVRKLNKVVSIFESHRQLNFERFYNKMNRYRKEYKPNEIFTLLESISIR